MITGSVYLRAALPAAAALVLSLFQPSTSSNPAAAATEEMKWERVNTPAVGEAGNWVLAPGSDVKHLTMARDGAIYAYANPTGTSYTLFKSSAGGFSWAATGGTGAITGIAAAADDPSIIYYATAAAVYKSIDAGKTFTPLPASPGGAGSGNVSITAIALGRANGKSLIATGTTDNDSGQFGGVYTLDESKPLPAWENTGVGNYDIASLEFSPNYASDRQLLAVVTDEADTFVTSKINTGGWNQIFGRAAIAGRAARGAAIAFPDDYDASRGEYGLFTGIETGSSGGDVFRIRGFAGDNSTATDLNAGAINNLTNIDICGLTASGNFSTARLMAGAAGSAAIYSSTDGGTNWTRSRKEPGQSRVYLLKTADSRTAYAGTSGAESAFSYTTDGGATWNQIGLIDGRISANGITDIGVSPDYSRDESLFMLTFDSVSLEQSLWRSRSGGARWERVFSSSVTNVDALSKITLPPAYGKPNRSVFLAGTAGGNPAIWKSADDGQTFSHRIAPLAIDIWTASAEDSLFFGSYNGTNGVVYSTEDGGFLYSAATAAGSQTLKSLAVSPDYARDRTVLAGNSVGWIYYSNDGGSSFKPLPRDATAAPLTGSIYVAFDSDFANNKTLYAASSTANKGIYRFVIDKSAKWERIDAALPSGGTVNQIAVSADGTLYAANSQSTNTTANKGGIERSLNPLYSLGPTFESFTSGLDEGATATSLWLQSGRLWTIDTQNTRVMTLADSLARTVVITSPPDKAGGTGKSVTLKWEALNTATEYEWQIDSDTDFTSVPTGFSGTTKTSSVKLPALDSDTTYYWRVRASKPALSRWSAESSFNTGLGTAVIAPELLSPKAGAEGTSLRPLFQWSAIAGATSYELLVADDVSFANPAIKRSGETALPETAWQSNTALEYDKTYYWKVRASGAGGFSAWSSVGAFITQTRPAAQTEQPAAAPPQTPSPPQIQPQAQIPQTPPASPPPAAQPALPDWFPYIIGGLLLAVVILLITVLLLVVNMRRN